MGPLLHRHSGRTTYLLDHLLRDERLLRERDGLDERVRVVRLARREVVKLERAAER